MSSLSWDQSNFMPHRGLQLMMRDMNHLYKDVISKDVNSMAVNEICEEK